MRIRAAVFPFHERMLPFVRHFNQNQNTYQICQALAWSGMGLKSQDVAYICRHPAIGIPVVSPTESESFMDWQVLFVDNDMLEGSGSSFDPFTFFEQLLSAGKQIVVATGNSDPYSIDKWNILLQKYSNQIELLSEKCSPNAKKNLLIENSNYKSLSVPVIMVGGLITQEDCLEIVLALRESLTRRGENVSCITGSNIGLLTKMHSYCHIFNATASISGEEQAISLNKMARGIVLAEHSTILLVEAPDPMLKYNNLAPNGFGFQTYIACQALNPDALVCSVPSDLSTGKEFYNLLSKDFEIRYGVPISAVHVSNVVIDSLDVIQLGKITRVHIDLEHARPLQEQKDRSRNFPAFDVISEGADELADFILQGEGIL